MTTTNSVPLRAEHYTKTSEEARGIMGSHFRSQHEYLIHEAEARVLDLVRAEWCRVFDIDRNEEIDGEGGGHVTLTFPAERGWDEETAADFAINVLALDLTQRDNGPGRYFSQSNTGTLESGTVIVWVRWGLDI